MNQPTRNSDAEKSTYDEKDAEWWIILSTPSHNAYRNEAENHYKKRQCPKKFGSKLRAVSISDWLMVLFTAVIAYYASAQYAEMNSASKQTDRIIAADERLAAAMETSVTTSGHVLDATIAQNQLDQRAWVGVKAIDAPLLEANKPVGSAVHLTNTGKTIALHTIADVVIKPSLTKLDIAKYAISKDRTFASSHSPIVIFPNFDFAVPIKTTENATAQDIENIKAHKLFIYIFGEVHYSDIFQHSHVTHFCGLLNPDVTPPVYNACETYDDAN